VSLGTYQRALQIANALAVAGRRRGFDLREDEKLGRLVFSGYEAEIQMRFTEHLEDRVRQRVGYDGKPEQERYKVPTGRIRLSLQIEYREGPTFEDKKAQGLESILNRVFVVMYRLVIKCWERDRAHRAAELRAKEAERIRAEKEKIRAEQERKALAERRRRKRLLREAGRWVEATRLREYVAYIRSASGSKEEASISQWATWALAVADALDPTVTQPRRSEYGDRKSESEQS
jgi:hypothetical protein